MVNPRRIAGLFVPDLPLCALLRAEPELSGLPVAVIRAGDPRSRVAACSAEALRAGVVPGMTAAQASSLFSGLTLRRLSSAQIRSAREALLDVARSFSPRVAPEADSEVCLDLCGLSCLWPCERRLGVAILARAREAGLPARAGIASGRFVARLAARTADGLRIVAGGEERVFLDPLPVALLPASADLRAALRRFGIGRLGQLSRLPPGELGLRLGPEGLRLWRLTRGEEPEPFFPARLREHFVEESDTVYPLERIEPLLLVLEGIFQRLLARLGWRGLGAQALHLSLGLDPAGADERCLRFGAPTGRLRAWASAARLSLEERPPRAPVIAVRVEAEAEPVRGAQLQLFAPVSPAAGKLDEAAARMAARVGEGRVGSPLLADSHRPEAVALAPFGTGGGPVGQAGRARPPLRLIRPALEVEVRLAARRPVALRGGWIHGRVRGYAGPWRLEGNWWEQEPLCRDYYEVDLSDGGIYRLYRDRELSSWFVDAAWG